jgi:hypothetical protein
MSRMIFDYTKKQLEKASNDAQLFVKELKKAIHKLFPHELEMLKKWLVYFTSQKPELQSCLSQISF